VGNFFQGLRARHRQDQTSTPPVYGQVGVEYPAAECVHNCPVGRRARHEHLPRQLVGMMMKAPSFSSILATAAFFPMLCAGKANDAHSHAPAGFHEYGLPSSMSLFSAAVAMIRSGSGDKRRNPHGTVC